VNAGFGKANGSFKYRIYFVLDEHRFGKVRRVVDEKLELALVEAVRPSSDLASVSAVDLGLARQGI